MSDIGNSNRIAREYIDSLRIETRYMDSTNPTLDFELYGERFASPIMTAALSHLKDGEALAKGAQAADAVCWYGMATKEEIERLNATGARLIEIIKPYADRDMIYDKIKHAEGLGLLAVGIDIDHPFGSDGGPDIVDGTAMAAIATSELAEICSSTHLPVIAKGVLSLRDAERCLAAGIRGMVLSHHNNRIEYAVPPLAMLPEIAAIAGNTPLFVDCEIKTGMDAFKALALGAKGVCIGRPLMAAISQGGADAVRDYLLRANAELGKAMAFTGCTDLSRMDPTVIRRI